MTPPGGTPAQVTWVRRQAFHTPTLEQLEQQIKETVDELVRSGWSLFQAQNNAEVQALRMRISARRQHRPVEAPPAPIVSPSFGRNDTFDVSLSPTTGSQARTTSSPRKPEDVGPIAELPPAPAAASMPP